MSNPITDAMATLSVSQELALYQFLGVAVVDDLRAESEASAGKYPGLRREAITHCHQSLFDCGLDEVTNLPPTVKHNPPPETSEYMTEVAQYEPEPANSVNEAEERAVKALDDMEAQDQEEDHLEAEQHVLAFLAEAGFPKLQKAFLDAKRRQGWWYA